MTDAIRLTKLPSSTTLNQVAAETNASPAAEQKKLQTGIASTKDSFQVKQESSLFAANTNTGEVRFGDGVSGKRPPTGNSAALLQQSKSEISSYLKGDGNAGFRGMKQYLMNTQNQKIDEQMKQAGEKYATTMNQATTGLVTGVIGGTISIGTAIGNLKQVASEAKNDLAHNPALEARFKHFTSSLHDFEAATKSDSKTLQKQSDKTQIEVSRMEQAEQNSDSSTYDSKARDRHKASLDAIQHFLDILHDSDPKI